MSYGQTTQNNDFNNVIGIVGEWVIFTLPHQTKLLQGIREKNLLQEIRKMNFDEAINVVKDGGKVRRCSWDESMAMWWEKLSSPKVGYAVHSHPYYEGQPPIDNKGAYIYVVENDDSQANDWIRVA